MIPFILGLLIGFSIGFIVVAVLNASRHEEDVINWTLPETGEDDDQ